MSEDEPDMLEHRTTTSFLDRTERHLVKISRQNIHGQPEENHKEMASFSSVKALASLGSSHSKGFAEG